MITKIIRIHSLNFYFLIVIVHMILLYFSFSYITSRYVSLLWITYKEFDGFIELLCESWDDIILPILLFTFGLFPFSYFISVILHKNNQKVKYKLSFLVFIFLSFYIAFSLYSIWQHSTNEQLVNKAYLIHTSSINNNFCETKELEYKIITDIESFYDISGIKSYNIYKEYGGFDKTAQEEIDNLCVSKQYNEVVSIIKNEKFKNCFYNNKRQKELFIDERTLDIPYEYNLRDFFDLPRFIFTVETSRIRNNILMSNETNKTEQFFKIKESFDILMCILEHLKGYESRAGCVCAIRYIYSVSYNLKWIKDINLDITCRNINYFKSLETYILSSCDYLKNRCKISYVYFLKCVYDKGGLNSKVYDDYMKQPNSLLLIFPSCRYSLYKFYNLSIKLILENSLEDFAYKMHNSLFYTNEIILDLQYDAQEVLKFMRNIEDNLMIQ